MRVLAVSHRVPMQPILIAPAMARIGRARRASVKDLVTVKLRPQAKASKPCCTGQT